ncbi:MAG: HEAT repeat domain-containing protein [Verrucomicrobia bacterium]|nr:HEAT repeat domain-containing protein [Verrucomicrobiota bacterium]MDA1046840.1 HEAT repeat domain-containing protein [Verrucomicrobiota bacterium]
MSEWLIKGFVFAALLPLGQAMAWQAPVRVSPNLSVVPLSDENVSVVAEANASVTPKPVRSSTQETINQAGLDLRHVEENVRSGAARLLGKYPSPASAAYLTFALDDRIARVRRAAIVSLAELYLNGFYIYEKPLVEKILSKLGDPDVEVRREVSALIPRLSIGLFRSSFEIVEINGRRVARAAPATLRADLMEIARKAFFDPDAIVRQNILKYHYALRLPLSAQVLDRLLSDSDLGVLLTALNRVPSSTPSETVVRRVEKLSRHPDVGVRKKVVSVARDSNRRHPGYRAILRKMTMDEEPAVLSMAAVELARLGEKVDPKVIQAVGDYLLGVAGASTQVMTILYAVSAFGDEAIEIYSELTEHTSSQIRTIAWQRLLTFDNGWGRPDVWLPALADRDKTVRRAVVANLSARSRNFDLKTMEQLVASDFVDVRTFAASSLYTARQDAAEEVAFDLLIDEDNDVRAQTIRALASRRTPGWLKIMSNSLLDEEYVIKRAALDGLLGDPVQGVKTIRKFVSEHPTDPITPLALAELKSRGITQ